MNPHEICHTFHSDSGRLCQIVNFTHTDLGSIIAIEKRAAQIPWSEKNFRNSLSASHLCVGVKIEEKWIAFAIFSTVAGQAELLLLAVDPDFQGQKIASRLLSVVEQTLSHSTKEIFLEVRKSNSRAIQLYESLAFNCLGERPNYYPIPETQGAREDALIYGKFIGKL